MGGAEHTLSCLPEVPPSPHPFPSFHFLQTFEFASHRQTPENLLLVLGARPSASKGRTCRTRLQEALGLPDRHIPSHLTWRPDPPAFCFSLMGDPAPGRQHHGELAEGKADLGEVQE